MDMRFRNWSVSTRILVLSAVGVIVLAIGCAVSVALFTTVPNPSTYLIVIPVAGLVGAVPVVVFAIAFGFKPQPRTGVPVVAVLYGALVLLVGTWQTIENVSYWINLTPPPTDFGGQATGLALFLVSMPGAAARKRSWCRKGRSMVG